jgi:hypothetical protein
MSNIIFNYHKTRRNIDMAFIESVFDADDRDMLSNAKKLNPNSIIRMPGHDLKTKGMKGSVPNEWDGSIVQLS